MACDMASVQLKNIRKTYQGGVLALEDISLTIADGDFFVLVGPSGCGKSTLLRMIAGLEDVTDGEIYIGDRLINEIPAKDRDVAMVFQNYALYPHMTVYDNMSFALRHMKIPKNEIKSRVHAAAEVLELTELLLRKPRALSGGQRQRVAVGRAIVRNPTVFLFDEPLSNLDAKLRLQMRVEISRLHKQLQTTMIYVTHDQIEAMTMGTRIVVLKDGRIQQVDTPRNLYENPANQFVAGFIGSPAMNFLQGKIRAEGDVQLTSNGVKMTLPNRLADSVRRLPDGEGVVGIRPEHLYNFDEISERPVTPAIPVVIDIVEPVGGDAYIHFRLGGAEYCMRSPADIDYKVGDTVKICMDAEKVRLFDPSTGVRLS